MSVTALNPSSPARVEVTNDAVVIHHFCWPEPAVRAFVGDAADPAVAVGQALTAGAHALSAVRARLDGGELERTTAAMRRELQQAVEAGRIQLESTIQHLVNADTGVLPAAIAEWRARTRDGLAELLAAEFDPERRAGALGRIDEVLTRAAGAQSRALREILDPETEHGPIARLAQQIAQQQEGTANALARLSEHVVATAAASSAEVALLARTSAVKGLKFEDTVGAAVTAVTSLYGDVYEATATSVGSDGGKKGDAVVTVHGPESQPLGRYVIEAKDRRLSLRAILTELDEARSNRDAHAAIAVFASEDSCPSPGPVDIYGDRAVVVLDKDQPDLLPLRVACSWARALTAARSRHGEAPDKERVVALVDEARRALAELTTVRRAHAAAHKQIDQAGTAITRMVTEVEAALAQVAALTEPGAAPSLPAP